MYSLNHQVKKVNSRQK